MKKRLLLAILISFIIILSQPVIDMIFKCINKDSISSLDAASIKTVDLTGIMTGSDATHTHIYERKYNNNEHWEQCWICGNIINRKTHNVQRTPYSWGYQTCYPGNNYTIYCVDGCGYSVTTKDACVSNNTYTNIPLRYLHTQKCKNCGVWMNSSGCVDANGRRLNCQNIGTCVICKHTYTKAIHHVTNNGKCEFCNQTFVELVNSNVSYASDNSYAILEWRLRGVNGGVLTGLASWHSPNPAESKTYTISKNANNDYTYRYKIVFKSDVQNSISANIDSDIMLQVNGEAVHFGGWGLSAYYDHVAPTANSITVTGNGTSSKFSTKAIITAKVRETFSDTVEMRLLSSDRKTVIAGWGAATESGDIFTRAFDVVAEIREPSTLYVESRDKMGNVSTQSITVQYIDAKAPTLTSQSGNNTNWSKNKQITYTATDEGIGEVQIAFNNQNDFEQGNKNGDTYSRTYNFVGDVYGTVTGAIYLKDGLGNIRTERVTISNIDNTAPTITNVEETISTDKRSMGIRIEANDRNERLQKEGSGIGGYGITTSNNAPGANGYQSSNTFNITKNGRYYLWVRDNVGNVTRGREILVKDLEIKVGGEIRYEDETNRYNSRVGTNIKLYRKVGNGEEELVGIKGIEGGGNRYEFNTRECNDRGEKYTFRVEEEKIAGYKTEYEGNNVTGSNTENKTINIKNTLIVPKYNTEIEYTAEDTYENRYLKNGKVRINGVVENKDGNIYEELGLNKGKVEVRIDEGIEIETETIKIRYTNKEGEEKEVKRYEVRGNVIEIEFGEEGITKVREKIEIEVKGKIKEIKEYNSSIELRGKLRSYIGENTEIDLGEISKKEKEIRVEYQMPKASVRLRKVDSITNENMTGVEFTLYEWNGEKYEVKEIIRDEDKDGYYDTSRYEWNVRSQGKYKIEETTIEPNHKDNKFSMEYEIKELKEEDYTIIPEYEGERYRIRYEEEPDGLDRARGIIENEPYKIKVKLHNIDSQTKVEIDSKAVYKIYEWNRETGSYEEYVSYINGEKVEIKRQVDKTYKTEEYIYYTKKNEGKYRVIEEIAAYGYYGDYDTETKEKRKYEINIEEIVGKGKYEEQEVENEGTIEIYNNADKRVDNARVKGEINVQVVDSESKRNIAQGDGTLEGAVYGLYAREQINHADGTTSRYEGEKGVLYKKDEQVMIGRTDKEGKFKIDEIEGGKYYLKQIEANEGYMADEKEYDFDLTYQGQEIEKIIKNQIILLRVKKQAVQIVKIIVDYEEDADTLSKSGFRIYLVKELKIVKEGKISRNEDGTYTLNDEEAKENSILNKKANSNGTYKLRDLVDYYYKIVYNSEEEMEEIPRGENEYYPYRLEGEKTAGYYEEGEERKEVGEIYTNEEGYVKSPELPYGEYIMLETTVPDNYETANGLEIKVEKDSREAQKVRYIYDPNFETRVKIHLKDSNTKENILRKEAKFVIENKETGELVTYKDGKEEIGTYQNPYRLTREDGIFVTPMVMKIGKYVIKELEAPEGYVLRGKEGHSEEGELVKTEEVEVEFEIGTNQMYYVDDYYEENMMVEIEENTEQVGTIEVEIKGEGIKEIERKNEEEIIPKYSLEKLEGVEMGLYAKEDIYTQDNQGKIRYKKDELVRIGKTNEEGKVYFENVEIGKYYIKEKNTINGYIENKIITEIEYKYGINKEGTEGIEEGSKEWKEKAQETAVIFMKKELLKERQKVKIQVENYDVDQEKINGGKYGIYAKEDIENRAGEVVIKAGELLKTERIEEGGKVVFNIDLPLGEYKVKELEAREGHISNKEEKDVDARYNLVEGRTIERIVVFTSEYTKVRIKVVDKDTKEEVIGAKLNLTDKEGKELIGGIESKEGGVVIIKIPIGEYYLEETEAPKEKGYVKTKKIKLEVEEKEEEQEVELEQDYTKIRFEIKDEEEKEVEEGEYVIKNEKGEEVGRYKKEKKESSEEEKGEEDKKEEKEEEIIKRLPIGKYKIESIKLPEQYAKIEEEFEIIDTQGIQIYVIRTKEAEFDMKLEKWTSKTILIEEGLQKVRMTGIEEEGKIVKVDLNKKRIEETIIKFVYTIKVTNVGEVTGKVEEIEEEIPEGLEFIEEENREWREEGEKIKSNSLREKEIKPGESEKIEIVLKWKNSGDNIGEKENVARISKTSNKYGIKEKEEKNNEGRATVLLGIVTGKESIKIYVTIVIILGSVISLGVIVIKRYVI